MMKTPEEIKKGLEACRADECHGHHTGCPYDDDFFCIMHICGDALAYIEQFEKRTSLNTLRDAIYEDAVAHGLWDDVEDYMPADCMSEFCEALANAIISSLSVAGYLGIDIDAAVRRKMEINKGRPWKHGKEEQGNA